MGRRKTPSVTLATVAALRTIAETQTETFGRPDNPARPGDPTPERLARAGFSVAMQIGTGNVQIIGAGANVMGYDGVVRLEPAPLDRLHSRNRLDEEDPERNRVLYEAGRMLRRHHYDSGLAGFATACNDPSRVGRTDPSQREAITERMERGRRALYRAEAAMHRDSWQAVRSVVLEEQTLEDVGMAAGFGKKHAACAVALDRLRRGLSDLAELWGYIPPERPDAVKPDAPANANANAIEAPAAA